MTREEKLDLIDWIRAYVCVVVLFILFEFGAVR